MTTCHFSRRLANHSSCNPLFMSVLEWFCLMIYAFWMCFIWKWVSCANTTHNAFLNSKLFIRWSSHVTKCHNKIANLQESHPNGAHWTISTVMLAFLQKPTPGVQEALSTSTLPAYCPYLGQKLPGLEPLSCFHVSWISLGCSLLGMYPYLGSFIVVSFYGR